MASRGVFLSFRGEDTRHCFTDHLYEALRRAGIGTFRDEEEIKTGEKLKPEIERIIKESRASVVVLSTNYATSTWCLDELALILEQRRKCNHFVLPVFYQVDPSDVRKQNQSFAIEVKAASRWTDENVNMWKKALREVADLKGMESSGYESKFLKKIVDTIYNELDRKEVHLPPNITGMATRYREISSWLARPGVEFLAICGMGGSGKTTLAKYIYNLNRRSYENMSFVEDIGRICKGPHGLRMLQKQLLEDILGGRKSKIPSVSEGTYKIEEALQTKRSLIVLDDISEDNQFVALLGTGKIHAESKIIITTTRENTQGWFKSTNWSCQDYKMELLKNDESLELLSCHAFGSKEPMEGFREVAEQAVRYCEGNPLALEVLASALSQKNTISHWKSQLRTLEKDIHSRIQNVLIMSYNSLSLDIEKDLFLHIACFFVGKDKDYVEKILEEDCSAESGITSLSNRCLLSVSPKNKLMMHRLVQEMGKRIVRQESKLPEERSRVWLSSDSYKILSTREGSKTMEGLALDMQMLREQKFAVKSSIFKTDALQKMYNLKLLQLNFVQLTGSYENFPEYLRWLCWLGSDITTIPSELFMGNLVAMDMSYSKLKVFEPPMVLQSLQILNLTDSHDLSEIRNMSMMPQLETLILNNCDSLDRVCDTAGDLTSLALLDMTGCKKLCKSEQTDLGLDASTSGGEVAEQPTISFPCSLHRLFLKDCNLDYTDSFPLSFHDQLSLQYLNLGNSLFESLPCYVHLINLRVLDLSLCAMLKRLVCLPSTLAELYVYYCISLEEISFQSHRFTLQEFGYEGCISLSEIEGFIKLVHVAKLEENDLGHMKWVKEYQNHEVCLVGDDELTNGRSWCVQMLYEFNIMSTSLPNMEDPNVKPMYVSSELSSLSFDVPPPPENRRLKGIDVTFKYTTVSGDDDMVWFCRMNTSSGTVDLMYHPQVFGKPEVGEVGIWLSYWPIGGTLTTGDKVSVSIAVISGLEVHECGVSLVYSHDEETMEDNMTLVQALGGDLSGFQLSTGACYLCRRDFIGLMEVGRLAPSWFSILVGDTIDCTEVRGWRKTGRPTQLNPSFTELNFVQCIIHGPESEEFYNIAEMSKSSFVDKPLDFTSSLLGETMKSSTSSISSKTKIQIKPQEMIMRLLSVTITKLSEMVTSVAQTTASFRAELELLSVTLQIITQIIYEIVNMKRKLDRTEAECKKFLYDIREAKMLIDYIQETNKVFDKYPMVKGNAIKKSAYSQNLKDVNTKLRRFFQIDVQEFQNRGITDMLLGADDDDGDTLSITSWMNSRNSVSTSVSASARTSWVSNYSGILSMSIVEREKYGWRVPALPNGIVGFDEPLARLKTEVFAAFDYDYDSSSAMDYDGRSVLVIAAAGGFGKTTLVKMLCHDPEIRENFGENIFFVAVSETSNFMMIVGDLFSPNSSGQQVLLQSNEDANTKLENFLYQKVSGPMLLVLDGVWSESFLDIFPSKNRGCMILVTSRTAFTNYDVFKIDPLNEKDAKTLFCQSAFDKDGRRPSPIIVNQMVKCCKRHPLILAVVGRSLNGKEESVWRSMLNFLSRGRSVLDLHKDLPIGFERSFEALDYGSKECFLDLGLFPEDQRIPVNALLDMWVHLYNHDDGGVDTFAKVNLLSYENLVDLITTGFWNYSIARVNYCDQQFITQHGLLRDLALHLNSRLPLAKRSRLIINTQGEDLPASIEHAQGPMQARILSISTGNSFSSRWCYMEVPDLEVLILNLMSKTYTLPPFLARNPNLKILNITNRSLHPTEFDNFQLLGSAHNLTRIRFERVMIYPSILSLENLQKVSFIMCKFSNTFKELIPNIWPQLIEIEIDYCQDLVKFPGALCSIVNLRKISITNCNEMRGFSEHFGNLTNLEMLSLRSCTKLEKLPESIWRLERLSVVDISDCLSLSGLPEKVGKLGGLRTIYMKGCKGVDELPESVEELSDVRVVCNEEIAYLWQEFSNVEIDLVGEDGLETPIRLVPVAKLEAKDLGHMKWLKEYQNHEVFLVGDDELIKARSWCVQMLYEFNIMSTSLPNMEDPNMKPMYVSELSSLSFDVPPPLKNRRLKGIDVTCKYTVSADDDMVWFCKISTANGVDLMYNPQVFGKPEFGEVGIWLSYWPIGGTLATGDNVSVSIAVISGLEVHECGVTLVYTDDEVAEEILEDNITLVEALKGDLSGFRLSTEIYYLCRRDFFELMEVGRLTPHWFSILVGDTVDCTEVRGWRKTGRPTQLNTSIKELNEIQESTSSPHGEMLNLLATHGVTGEMKVKPQEMDMLLSESIFKLSEMVAYGAQTTADFRRELKLLDTTLQRITPIIQDTVNMNRKLDRTKDECKMLIQEIQEAEKLVKKCLKVKRNMYKKYIYSLKLKDFNGRLLRFFQVEVQAIQTRVITETLKGVNDIKIKMDSIASVVKELQLSKSWIGNSSGSMSMSLRTEQPRGENMEREKYGCEVNDIKIKMDSIASVVKELQLSKSWIGNSSGSMSMSLRTEQPRGENMEREKYGWRVPALPNGIVAFDEPLAKLKAKVVAGMYSGYDDSSVMDYDGRSVLVVAGAGGCGKTTLVKMLCHDPEIRENFGENIFFVAVSETPNFMMIVNDLFNPNSSGQQVLLQSNEDANTKLENFLYKKVSGPMLLVLDDVWSESFIDNFPSKHRGCMILVTSRTAFTNYDVFKIDPLNEKDAKTLFRQSAFNGGRRRPSPVIDENLMNQVTIYSIPKMNIRLLFRRVGPVIDVNVVNQMVACCKRHPLTLSVVGRSLNGKDESVWESMLKSLSEGRSVLDLHMEVLIGLERSFEALDDELKECFLDLGLFPEDQRIPVSALLNMWAHLYNYDDDGRDTVAKIFELSCKHLVDLMTAGDDSIARVNHCDQQFVTQHGLLRGLAIHLNTKLPLARRSRLIINAQGEDLPASIEHVQEPMHARILSISTGESFSSRWCNMEVPYLEVLILNLMSKTYTLPNFLAGNPNLRILNITNHGLYPTQFNNFHLLTSSHNLTRIRLECVALSPSILSLMNLQKVSLIMCKLGNIFKKLTTNTPNIWPQIVEIEIDYCQDLVDFPGTLCNSVHLKKISITNCNEMCGLDEEFGSWINLGMLSLRSCTNLEKLPESIWRLEKLSVLDISDCLSLSGLPEKLGKMSSLRTIYMKGCMGVHELPESVEELSDVRVVCNEEIASQWQEYSNVEIDLVEEDRLETLVNLVHVAKLEEIDLGHMKWLKKYQDYEVCLVGDDELIKGRSWCVQMLYEFNIMSTSLPNMEDPNMKPMYVSELSSLSFDVPPPLMNRRLKGIDVTCKYTVSADDDMVWFCKISTANGVDLMYNPQVFGKPEFGEVGIWLSYWPIGGTLATGDNVSVSIAVISGLEVLEFGVSLVYTDHEEDKEALEDNMTLVEALGGDLSGFQLSTGAYYLCRRDFFGLMEVGRLTPGWFSNLVGETIHCTEVRGWRKTGRPMQLNPSIKELNDIQESTSSPHVEKLDTHGVTGEMKVKPQEMDMLLYESITELLEIVIYVAQTTANFKPELKLLDATLNRITPIIQDTVNMNRKLHRTKDECKMFIQEIQEGQKLVIKCLKVKRNMYKKYIYSLKLKDFNGRLLRFFQIEVQAIQTRAITETLLGVNDMKVKMDSIASDLKELQLSKSWIGNHSGSMSMSVRTEQSSGENMEREKYGWRVPALPNGIVAFDEPLAKLKAKVVAGMYSGYDDSSVMDYDGESVVVVAGAGGCGKTTLVKMLCHDPEIRENFGENIFFVTVSETPNFMEIVTDLFNPTSSGQRVLLQSKEDARRKMEKFLDEKVSGPTLLVLDDVWSESFIDNFPTKNREGKILVTSRTAFTGYDVFQFNPLKYEEAKALFCRSAFDEGRRRPSPVIDVNVVNQMVACCKRHPLTLSVVGRSLNGKDESVWESMLKSLSEGRSVLDLHMEVLIGLERSFEALDDELKECFLDLGLFPEDQRIPVSALLNMWAHLYNYDDDGRDTVANIFELSCKHLVDLMTAGDDSIARVNHCDQQFVTQHGLLRGLAIHLNTKLPLARRSRLIINAQGEDLPASIEHVQEPMHARILSISTGESFSSRWCNMEVPYLEVLILNLMSKTYTLPNFLAGNPNLRILNITNHGLYPTQFNNFHLLTSSHNLTRIRLECVALSPSILSLMNLQKVSLIMCKLGNIFKKLTTNTPNIWPQIVEIEIDYCQDLVDFPGTLCNSVHLKKISITNCNEMCGLDEEFGSWINLGMLSLRSCTNLEKLPESIWRLEKLSVLDISDCLSLSGLPEKLGKMSSLRTIYMKGCMGVHELPESVEELSDVRVVCNEEIASQWQEYSNVEIDLVEEDRLETLVNLVHVAKLEEIDLGHMKWLKKYQDYEVCLVGDDELIKGRSWCVQMLYEFNIMSTSLPNMEDPNMKPMYVSELSSLSFDVPPPLMNRRLKGIDVTCKYTVSADDDMVWFCKISTANGVDLMYNPQVFGKPEFGEVGIWLSYWPIGGTLATGDNVSVSIAVISGLEVLEFGVSLVYTDHEEDKEALEDNMTLVEALGGDLSGFQLSTGAYYLCRRDFFGLMEVGRLTPGWFSNLVGETIHCTEVRGWRKTGRPMQLNPSIKELNDIQESTSSPHVEKLDTHGVTGEMKVKPQEMDMLLSEIFKLSEMVVYGAQTTADFRRELKLLDTTLKRITPIILDTVNMNRKLNRTKDECKMFIQEIQEAEKLVKKCLKVKRNLYKKYTYSPKLKDLNSKLLRFFQIEVQAIQSRGITETLLGVNDMKVKMDSIASDLKELQLSKSWIGNHSGSMSMSVRTEQSSGENMEREKYGWRVPALPNGIVAFDEPLAKLKAKVVAGMYCGYDDSSVMDYDGRSVVVVAGAGGCGKTTLVKMLCHDPEIRENFGENIFFVTVSETPNFMEIVTDLFNPTSSGPRVLLQSKEDAQRKLEKFLNEKVSGPMLLVLDDVWSESFIDNFPSKNREGKILVTSRTAFTKYDMFRFDSLC